MTYLLPGERLDGTAAERAHLRRLLLSFRTDPPPMRLRDVSGCPLPELLDSGTIDSRAWISSGASRSAASRALTQSARRPQVP